MYRGKENSFYQTKWTAKRTINIRLRNEKESQNKSFRDLIKKSKSEKN